MGLGVAGAGVVRVGAGDVVEGDGRAVVVDAEGVGRVADGVALGLVDAVGEAGEPVAAAGAAGAAGAADRSRTVGSAALEVAAGTAAPRATRARAAVERRNVRRRVCCMGSSSAGSGWRAAAPVSATSGH